MSVAMSGISQRVLRCMYVSLSVIFYVFIVFLLGVFNGSTLP